MHYKDLRTTVGPMIAAVAGVQAIIDKMKSVSSTLTVATTKVGDLHLQVESGGVHIACELRSLLPDSDTNAAAPLMCATNHTESHDLI